MAEPLPYQELHSASESTHLEEVRDDGHRVETAHGKAGREGSWAY